MATTITPHPATRRPQQPRVSTRARHAVAGRDARRSTQREAEYDLLTAALIGATIGAGVTFMLRRGPSGRRPVSPLLQGAGRGAHWAARHAASAGRSGARWAADRGEAMWDRVPRDKIRATVSDYVGQARDTIDDAVASELRDLRRALRRQRKRLGL